MGFAHRRAKDLPAPGASPDPAPQSVLLPGVRLEGRAHMDIVKQFNVTGAPTTLIFSPDGKELYRFAGFYPPAEYLKELEKYG